MAPLSAALERLSRHARFPRLILRADHLEHLDRYLELLLRWNRRIRLVGPSDPDTLVDEHLLDCLNVADTLLGTGDPPEGAIDGRAAVHRTLIDVGSGAGLPGVILSLVLPDLAVTLCEPSEKRCAFLHEVHRLLGTRYELYEGAVEALLDERPGTFDHAICRATFEPEAWTRTGSALVRPGGSVWYMLAQRQLAQGSPGTMMHYTLPRGKTRTLVRWIVGSQDDPAPCFT